jgi:hypothetical protein
VIEKFTEVLRSKIREDMNNYADDIAGGSCRNFEEYKELCGVIRGLAIAERYLLDLAKNVEDADD